MLKKNLEQMKETLGDYIKIGIGDYYVSSAHRWLTYAVVFLLVGLFTFISLPIYEASDPLLKIPLTFKGMYAWHTAINYALCLAILDILAALVLKSRVAYDKRTVGHQWLIFLVTSLMGFAAQRTIVYRLVVLYSPGVLWVHEMNPSQRPGPIVMFFFILPFWMVIGGITMRIILRKQAQAQELFRIRIDAILEDRQLPARSLPKTGQPHAKSKGLNGDDYIPLPAGTGTPPIALTQVGHVTVEDHYLRIFYMGADGLKNVLIRMSLKELCVRMPEDLFVQVHRSHLVNLEQISRLRRSGRSIRVDLKHGDFELPVSRYRYPEILPKLEKHLHPE